MARFRSTLDFSKAERAIRAAGAKVLSRLAEGVAARARLHAPAESGRLRDSIGVEIDQAALKATIVVEAPYAAAVECGHVGPGGHFVAPHPFLRTALGEAAQELTKAATGVRLFE
jgi:hypothetical protein